MKTGPRPKPTQLKVVAGNPGKRPLNKDEPQPPQETDLRPPSHLNKEARKEWKRLAPLLSEARILSKIDRDALALYCDAMAIYLDAKKKLAIDGLVQPVGENNVIQQSPYLSIMNKQSERMRQFLEGFGMTPASRSRVTVLPDNGAAADEWDEFDR